MKGIVNIQLLTAHEGSSKNYFPEVILRLYAAFSGNSIIIVSRLLARIKEQSIFVLYTNLIKTNNRLKSCQSAYNKKCNISILNENKTKQNKTNLLIYKKQVTGDSVCAKLKVHSNSCNCIVFEMFLFCFVLFNFN